MDRMNGLLLFNNWPDIRIILCYLLNNLSTVAGTVITVMLHRKFYSPKIKNYTIFKRGDHEESKYVIRNKF